MRQMIQIQTIDFMRKNYSLFEYFVGSNSLLHFDDDTYGDDEGLIILNFLKYTTTAMIRLEDQDVMI